MLIIDNCNYNCNYNSKQLLIYDPEYDYHNYNYHNYSYHYTYDYNGINTNNMVC